jgi:hypothetical protein
LIADELKLEELEEALLRRINTKRKPNIHMSLFVPLPLPDILYPIKFKSRVVLDTNAL